MRVEKEENGVPWTADGRIQAAIDPYVGTVKNRVSSVEGRKRSRLPHYLVGFEGKQPCLAKCLVPRCLFCGVSESARVSTGFQDKTKDVTGQHPKHY
jgi:hypothetical protein